MKKSLKFGSLVIISLFAAIQFIRPEKNSHEETSLSLFRQTQIPGEVSEILKNSCLDCHSNKTRYQWYHQVAPVSWLVASHIKEGKNELNFSEWGDKTPIDQINLLTKIIDETKAGKMPLPSYSLIHSKARLSQEQIKVLNSWAESYGMDLFQKK